MLNPPPSPPPLVCSADHSKAVVPVLVLLFGALQFILRGGLLYVLPCAVSFLCFSVLLASRLPRLGGGRGGGGGGLAADIGAFRMFGRFLLVWVCRFPLALDVWEGLRFVVVALPRRFSYEYLYFML